MNAPTTSREYLELLRLSGVVPEERLVSYLRSRRGQWKKVKEPDAAAEQLLADGLVSQFQAQQMLRGKCKGFWIKKYLVLESLGTGGMGQVLLCEQTPMSRLVAVKILRTDQEPGALNRFVREARAVAALDHPNIVRAIDIDQDERFHFLVMEYVDGIDLQNLVSKHGRLEVERACHYLTQAALGLQHAHDAGWVHRDIKPGNLLVERGGCVKILDLGLARLTTDSHDQLTRQFDENAIIGTADYLAPEQTLPGEIVDSRADIYSLGVTSYFLLTAKTPFGVGSVLQKIVAHQVKKPQPLAELRQDLPKELVALIEKMMNKSPAHRPQSAREVAAVLRPLAAKSAYPLDQSESSEHCPRVRQLLQASTVQTVTLTDLAHHAKPGQRMLPLMLLGAAAAFLFCAIAGGLFWWFGPFSSNNPDPPKPIVKGKGPTVQPIVVPKVLTAEEAARNVNNICTVQMVVRSTGVNKTQSMLFLNSQENYLADNNFTIVVQRAEGEKDAEQWRAHFRDKTIRVTGQVGKRNNSPQISVGDPAQIVIVDIADKK